MHTRLMDALHSILETAWLTGASEHTIHSWLRLNLLRAAVRPGGRGRASALRLDIVAVITCGLLRVIQQRLGGQLPIALARLLADYLLSHDERELRRIVGEGRSVLTLLTSAAGEAACDEPQLVTPDDIAIGPAGGGVLLAVDLASLIERIDRAITDHRRTITTDAATEPATTDG